MSNGMIRAHGLTGFQAGSPGPGPVFLRLEWTTPAAGFRSAKSVQLAVPADFALQIADELRRTALQQLGLEPKGSA